MSPERIVELARALSREEFAKALTCWFLVILDAGEEEPPSSFETMDVSASAHKFLAPKPSTPLVHAIVKAEGNPYPDRISVGRARNCDVVLRHATVSKLHAHFLPKPGDKLEIVDLGSQVGTRVNGQPVAANEPRAVAPGTILLLGRVAARIADARAAYDLLKAQERMAEGSIPPPRSSVPGSAPGSRPSPPGPAPTPRPSKPASAPPPRASVPGAAPRLPNKGSGS
jgi:hypothetical protein